MPLSEDIDFKIPLDVAATRRVRARHFLRGSAAIPAFSPTAHPAVEIAWVERGHVDYIIGSRRFALEPGAVMVVPAGAIHQTTLAPGTNARSLWVELTPEQNFCAGNLIAAQVTSTSGLDAVGRLIHEESLHQRRDAHAALDGLTEVLVTRLLRLVDDKDVVTIDPRVQSAIAYVEDCFADPCAVEDLAQVAGMSRHHFSRAFRAATGRAPYAFVQDVRIRRARELLRDGRSVTETAFSVGFQDLSRFARTFRARVGVSPRDYRRH